MAETYFRGSAPFSYAIPRMRIHLILGATLVRLGTRLRWQYTKGVAEVGYTKQLAS